MTTARVRCGALRARVVLALLLVLATAAVAWWSWRGGRGTAPVAAPPAVTADAASTRPATAHQASLLAAARTQLASHRPAAPAATPAPTADMQPLPSPTALPPSAQTPVARPAAANATPSAPVSTLPAADSRREAPINPARRAILDPFSVAPPFDAGAYAADPAAWLAAVHPGRVHQCAQPGPGVPVLSAMDDNPSRVAPGGQVTVRVRAPPGAPVSFLSLDMGRFVDATLPCISVAADADGIASATFIATAGTSGAVQILAGSPLASGQVTVLLDVVERAQP